MNAVTTAEARPDVLKALRSLGGRGTLGDVVSSVGLPRDQVEDILKSLLESHQGHLEVSESGELVYLFDRKLIRRDRVPTIQRLRSAAKKILTSAFKGWIVAMLVVYFVVFVVLVILALVAMSRGGNRRSGGGVLGRSAGRHHGHFHFPSFWLWYYIWTPRWRLGSPYYGRRWEATLEKDARPPFYKKVFAFVFGPDRPEPTRKQLDRGTLRLIRARKGALTTAELVEHTAMALPDAEEEMGRLLGSYAGEPTVSRDGELVYTFPELMTSAHGAVKAREPNPAWMRMEYPLELTGNEKKHDAVIVGMNGFTLVAAATAPGFIIPQVSSYYPSLAWLGGTAGFWGLVIIPVVFSVLFFSIPLLRVLGVRRENRAREARNVRRQVLGLVYREALTGGGAVTVEAATAHVQARMKDRTVDPGAVEAALHQLAAEFDADVSAGESGEGSLRFSFPAIRKQFLASETVRRRLKLEEGKIGKVVYSSADSAEEASERDQAAFDRELAANVDLTAYLPSPDRAGFEDEFEIVAFEEELKRRAAAKV
ncbi:MAG: hypothetical protein IIB37_09315 [Gemmatimonadetes bacterium]|nr:hypothetical protein [Gemmatimonadota bacterium]